jgi:hypothetical protein
MTWSLSAHGHTPAPEETVQGQESPGWKGVEEKLFAELRAVLSKPEYGASGSEFHGNHVHGTPHASPEEGTHTHEQVTEGPHAGPADLPGMASGVAPDVPPAAAQPL